MSRHHGVVISCKVPPHSLVMFAIHHGSGHVRGSEVMYLTELVAVGELCIYIAPSSTATCTRASVSASSKEGIYSTCLDHPCEFVTKYLPFFNSSLTDVHIFFCEYILDPWVLPLVCYLKNPRTRPVYKTLVSKQQSLLRSTIR